MFLVSMNQDGEIELQEYFTGKDIVSKAISFFHELNSGGLQFML